MSNFTHNETFSYTPSTPEQLADARATLTRLHADDLAPMILGESA